MRIIEHPSPNFGPRRDGLRPSLVMIHYTAMPTAEAALERLCDPEAEVSSHYLIARDGRVWRLVNEADRAWHAGRGQWKGMDDINSRSIGIELANQASLKGFPPFPEAQMSALETLVRQILARREIPPEGVIGHSDIAPERKSDPGPKFDWSRLAFQGLAAPSPHTTVEGGGWRRFRVAASGAGYDVSGNEDDAVLRAVRLRHRPWAEGTTPDDWDVGCLEPHVDVGGVNPQQVLVDGTDYPRLNENGDRDAR